MALAEITIAAAAQGSRRIQGNLETKVQGREGTESRGRGRYKKDNLLAFHFCPGLALRDI